MKLTIYEVGGVIRNEMANEMHGTNLPIKDVDLAIEAPSYEAMREWALEEGFRIYLETPEHLTIRCGVPIGHIIRERSKDVDLVLCRIDGLYLDGRRPEEVFVGSIWDDLARRDARMNAIARNVETGEILDPHNGIADIRDKVIECVGNPMDRWRQDGLRILRHFRQSVELDFRVGPGIEAAISENFDEVCDLIRAQAKERRVKEMERMFRKNAKRAFRIMGSAPDGIIDAWLADGIWLQPTYAKSENT